MFGQCRGAGAGQAVDVDRPAHRELVDLGMFHVPRLDLEAVHEPAAEVADDRGVGRRAQVAVVLQAVEQHVEAVAEVARAEVARAGAARASASSSSAAG